MSPSSSPLRGLAYAAAGLAPLTLLLAMRVAPAWADPAPGPVKDLTAPTVELHTGVSSLDGTVTVEGTKRGAKARIDATVLFGKDSATLRPGARDRIRQVAKEFARKGPGKVRVIGYTDDLGPADHGLRLSIRRAGAVANVLADLLPRTGYPMTAVGKGEQDPAVPNTSEENRRKNRRVVITLDRAEVAQPEPKPTPPAEKPKPEPTMAASASAVPSASASVVPESPTPTTAPTASASPTSGASSSPGGSATPAAAPVEVVPPVTSRRDHSMLISNLFLALVLLMFGLAALHRYDRWRHRPDEPPGGAPTSPAPDQGDSDAADANADTDPAGDTTADRNDTPPPGPGSKPDTAAPAGAGADQNGPADLHIPDGRVNVGVVARPHTSSLNQSAGRGLAAARGDLDADLGDWFSDACDLPRLSLLGPVAVRAHGTPIARRKPFYTELLAFLALRPHGATPDQVAAIFSLSPARVRNDMKVLRDWLGTNPRTGRRHLPDARDTKAGRARGLAVYQVEGLLVDLDLFDRLLQRAEQIGPDGLADLDRALRLVRGRPFDQLRPHGWDWLHEGDRVDLHAEAAIQRASTRADDLRGRTDATPAWSPGASSS